MYVLTNRQMREADEYTIRELGVPSLLLMERAGIALADEAEKMAQKGKIVCVCGGGNNGGDGFVCARILKERGKDVSVVFYAEKTSQDCRVNMEKWTALGGEMETAISEDAALIVDCLYGTGFHGVLTGRDFEIVNGINLLRSQGAKVLSADVPSGVNGDNGIVEKCAVVADVTLCIGEMKTGALLGDGMDHSGKVVRADIGISLPEDGETFAKLIDEQFVIECIPPRKRNSHKGTYGKAAIVAGSTQYTGAAYLAAAACLRSGAGYITLYLPKDILPHYALKLPEVLLKVSNDGGRYAFNEEIMRELLGCDSIAYGMGMGVSEDVAQGAAWLISHYEGKLILDADGLNSLARYGKEGLVGLLNGKKCDVLLTPHVKEFSKLSGMSAQEIFEMGLSGAKSFAKETRVNLLLKNAASVITDGARGAVNVAGCSGQAKGGSGDVLAGVIAGLCAMGLRTYEAGASAAWLTGTAAELAALDMGEYSLTASDVIAYLGRAFLRLTKAK